MCPSKMDFVNAGIALDVVDSILPGVGAFVEKELPASYRGSAVRGSRYGIHDEKYPWIVGTSLGTIMCKTRLVARRIRWAFDTARRAREVSTA